MNKIEKIIKNKIIELDYPSPFELRDSIRDIIPFEQFDKCLKKLIEKNWVLVSKGRMIWIHNPKLSKMIKKSEFVEI